LREKKHSQSARSDRDFWRNAFIIFTVIAALNYLPILTGKIPFPENLVLRHAAWDQRTGAAAPEPMPEIGDLMTSFYPYHSLAARASRLGSLPLWNPYILGGTPLEANAQSAPFYPFNIPYYIFPLQWAWTICMIVRLFLAALFMTLLVRSIGGSQSGSILSGIVFSLCGFMTAWQGQSMGDAAIWLPMICYAVLRLHRSPTTVSIALAALSFAMPVLAGHPETAAHLTLTGCALALLLACNRFDIRFVACFALAGILALGLASVQIVPSMEWFRQLGTFVNRIPPVLSRHDGQGFFSRDLQASPSSALLRIPEAASYLGMLGLMSCPLALFHRSRRHALFFAAIAVTAAAVAFGVEPAHSIVAQLPILRSLKNGRLILLASFGVAALAGLGISVLEQSKEFLPPKNRRLALCVIGITFLGALGGIYEVHRATLVPVNFMRGPWGALLFLLAGAGLFAWRVLGGMQRRLFSILVCMLAALELLSFSYGYTGFTKAADVFPTAPLFEFLQSLGNPSTFRIAKSGYPIPANSGIIYGLESADGYEIPSERAKIFSSGLTEERDDAVFYVADRISQSHDRRLDMLNVKYWIVIAGSPEFKAFAKRPEKFAPIYGEGSIAVFENKSALPRLFAAPQAGIQVIPDAATQMARIQDPLFMPERTVYFSEKPAAIGAEEVDVSAFSSAMEWIRGDMNSYEFRTRTSSRSVLVLSQIFYPGWKATIDGTEVPVYPVDYALTGILAPEGDHTVTFFFQPHSFTAGAVLSVISLIITVGLVRPATIWRSRNVDLQST